MTECINTPKLTRSLRGNFPVLATAWTEERLFDEESQARLIEWLIESGVHGFTMMANASEAHAMSDSMQRKVLEYNMRRVDGRVPVIAAVSHFNANVAAEKARYAEGLGAACVLSMPPFFGRWGADRAAIFFYFEALSSAVEVPVMVQDHEVSGVPMEVELLAALAREFANVRYFKIEYTQSPYKIEKVLQCAGAAVEGIFGGTSGVYLLDEYERGACGTMPACYLPSVFTSTFELLESGQMNKSYNYFLPYLPLLHFELRMAGGCAWKAILKFLGIIQSDRIAGSLPAHWDDAARRQLLQHASRCDPATFGVQRSTSGVKKKW